VTPVAEIFSSAIATNGAILVRYRRGERREKGMTMRGKRYVGLLAVLGGLAAGCSSGGPSGSGVSGDSGADASTEASARDAAGTHDGTAPADASASTDAPTTNPDTGLPSDAGGVDAGGSDATAGGDSASPPSDASPDAAADAPAADASAACSLVGTWTGPVPAGPFVGGTVTMVIAGDGTYSGVIGTYSWAGTWAVTAGTMTVTDTAGSAACPANQVGGYTVTFGSTCNTADFAIVSDTCAGRSYVIDKLHLTRS
jgi:hypothetical protein